MVEHSALGSVATHVPASQKGAAPSQSALVLHSTAAAAAEVVAETATDEVGSSVVMKSNVVEVPRAVEVSAEVESELISVVWFEPRLVRDSVNDSLTVADEVSVVGV